MEDKGGIYVFDKNATDFSTTGLVGDINPLEATFTEERNGTSEVTITLSYDQYKRWKAFASGNIIKCKVPVRIPPVIANDQYADTVSVGT